MGILVHMTEMYRIGVHNMGLIYVVFFYTIMRFCADLIPLMCISEINGGVPLTYLSLILLI